MNTSTDKLDLPKSSAWTLLIAAFIGLVSAAALTLEKLTFWQNKAQGLETNLKCDINPIVGCGNVINTPQASIISGLPNPVVGIAAWAIILSVAVFVLSGVSLRPWHWIGAQIGVFVGLCAVFYLQYSSLYVIGALCPWCMLTWLVTIVAFWLVTARNLEHFFPTNRLATFVGNWFPAIIVTHVLVIALLIFARFGTCVFA